MVSKFLISQVHPPQIKHLAQFSFLCFKIKSKVANYTCPNGQICAATAVAERMPLLSVQVSVGLCILRVWGFSVAVSRIDLSRPFLAYQQLP